VAINLEDKKAIVAEVNGLPKSLCPLSWLMPVALQ
jgi:hypothetical protein